jgi:hypothetical protein
MHNVINYCRLAWCWKRMFKKIIFFSHIISSLFHETRERYRHMQSFLCSAVNEKQKFFLSLFAVQKRKKLHSTWLISVARKHSDI